MMDSRALRTFLPETAIKMVKSCHPRGGAREAGAADGVEIAANLDRRSMAATRARLVVRPTPAYGRAIMTLARVRMRAHRGAKKAPR